MVHRPNPETSLVRFNPETVRLPIALRDRLRRVASQRQDSKSNLVRIAIARYLDDLESEDRNVAA